MSGLSDEDREAIENAAQRTEPPTLESRAAPTRRSLRMSLREELVAAWQERLDRASNMLADATTAPALFKPEAVDRRPGPHPRPVRTLTRLPHQVGARGLHAHRQRRAGPAPDRCGGVGMNVTRRLNWGWLRMRLAFWRCRHDWMIGARKNGERACVKCGVWRWYPTTPAGGHSALSEVPHTRTRRSSEAATAPPAGPTSPRHARECRGQAYCDTCDSIAAIGAAEPTHRAETPVIESGAA